MKEIVLIWRSLFLFCMLSLPIKGSVTDVSSCRQHSNQQLLPVSFNDLFIHASRGDLKAVCLSVASLNRNFIDVNHVDDRSRDTLLTRAVESKNIELVKFLIWLGADINKSNSSGTTPLMKAIYSRSRCMISYILSLKDVLLDVKNNWNETALMIASSYEDFETIEELVTKGANIALIDSQGYCAHDRLRCFDDDSREYKASVERAKKLLKTTFKSRASQNFF